MLEDKNSYHHYRKYNAIAQKDTGTNAQSSKGDNLYLAEKEIKVCDKQTDTVRFSVSDGSLVLIANARRHKTVAKVPCKLLCSLLFFLFSSLSVFVLQG